MCVRLDVRQTASAVGLAYNLRLIASDVSSNSWSVCLGDRSGACVPRAVRTTGVTAGGGGVVGWAGLHKRGFYEQVRWEVVLTEFDKRGLGVRCWVGWVRCWL